MEKDETSLAAFPTDASCGPTETAAALIEDVCRGLVRDPAAARAAAVRLVTLLTLSGAAEGSRGGLAPWQKRRVDRNLRRCLHRPLRLEELAEQVALSVSHFARAFKDSFGTTPHGYITGLRLQRAAADADHTGEPPEPDRPGLRPGQPVASVEAVPPLVRRDPERLAPAQPDGRRHIHPTSPRTPS